MKLDNKKLKIDKHVPIPPVKYGLKKGKSKYDFLADLKVGDSIYINGISRNTIFNAASQWARVKNMNIKFVARNEKTGARIWRIK
jgi:hypothetical protein